MPDNQRQFFTRKPRVIEYMTLELYYPTFGYLRYVQNQYFEKTLGGRVYQPALMEVTPTTDDDSGSVSYKINLGRVGSQAKDLIKAINNTEYGWMTPCIAKIAYFLSNDTVTPYRTQIELTVGSVDIDQDNVSLTIDSANPRLIGVARRYNAEDFPGTGAKV